MSFEPEQILSTLTAEQIQEIELAAENRWLGEFARYQAEQDEKLAKMRENFLHFEQFTYTLMSAIDQPMTSVHIRPDTDIAEHLRLAMTDAYEIMNMGKHFRHLLAEVKRQPSVQSHWEEFAMLLRLSEDDDTAKYHQF